MGDHSNRTMVEDHGCIGWIAIPATASPPLAAPKIPRGIVVVADGNLQIYLPDGSLNATVIPVVAGPAVLPYSAVRLGASNTADIIGVL